MQKRVAFLCDPARPRALSELKFGLRNIPHEKDINVEYRLRSHGGNRRRLRAGARHAQVQRSLECEFRIVGDELTSRKRGHTAGTWPVRRFVCRDWAVSGSCGGRTGRPRGDGPSVPVHGSVSRRCDCVGCRSGRHFLDRDVERPRFLRLYRSLRYSLTISKPRPYLHEDHVRTVIAREQY